MQFFVQAWDRAGNSNGAWTSTLILDRTPPSAAISALAAAQDTTRFQVSWTSSDNVSGVNRVDVQVQDNGGAWQNWQTGQPASSSALFTGLLGHDYGFRARAVDQVGNTGSYSSPAVSTHVNTCTGDAFEPDNDYQTAKSLAQGTSEPRTICGAGDQDWFAFSAEAGKKYMFLTGGLGATTDTVLTLYRLDGTTLTQLRQDNRTNSRSSALTWQMDDQNQTLYVMVRHAESQVAGSAVTYTLQAYEAVSTYMPTIHRQ